MAVHLTLTDEQAEMLGFALTVALREQKRKAIEHCFSPNRTGYQDRANQIEELRAILDAAPSK